MQRYNYVYPTRAKNMNDHGKIEASQ